MPMVNLRLTGIMKNWLLMRSLILFDVNVQNSVLSKNVVAGKQTTVYRFVITKTVRILMLNLNGKVMKWTLMIL